MPVILLDLFQENIGKKIHYEDKEIYPYDKLRISNECTLRIKFISKSSAFPEGVVFESKKGMVVEEGEYKNIAFWYEKDKTYVDVKIKKGNKEIFVCNIWKDNDGEMYSLRGNNGMMVEKIDDKTRRYKCNFGFDEVDFSGMVFEIELLGDGKLESLID